MESENEAVITVTKDIRLPELNTDLSNVVFQVFGVHPFPWENMVGIVVCIVLLLFLLNFFKRV